VDGLPSTNNEDKVFNPSILVQENLSEVTVQVAPDKNVKKIVISHASLILEAFNPPLSDHELPFHKEVPWPKTLLLFSFENEEKVFKPEILTSKGVHTSLLPELSHRGLETFKIIKKFESPMEIFPCSYREDIRTLDFPGSIPTAGPPATVISTGSEVGPTTSLIVTSYSRIKGKEVTRRPMTKKQKRDYYIAMIRNNLGWKVKDFKGMSFEEIKAKFAKVWKQVKDFIPMGSKEEAERLKRKGLNLEQERVKKQKSSEKAHEIEKSTEEITKEKMKEMMQLVPVEDVYVQALQVKHPIIDWKVHTEGQRSYWKIIRLGGNSACYQIFIDLLKQLDREDLNQLWALVKEYLSIRLATSEKEMEL
nr:hypothetical protein [Tanacetum cinerariifolium]